MKLSIILLLLVSFCNASSYLCIYEEYKTHTLELRNEKRKFYRNAQALQKARARFRKGNLDLLRLYETQVVTALETFTSLFGDDVIQPQDKNSNRNFIFEESTIQNGYTLTVTVYLNSKSTWAKRMILNHLLEKSVLHQ